MADIEEGHQKCSTELELYKAALSNDWKKAESIFEKTKRSYGVVITERGETALHIAALAGHTDFVQKLVKKMDKNEINLEMKISSNSNEKGNAALHCAAISGNVKVAEAITMKDDFRHLASAEGNGNHFPIYMAARRGNNEMVRFLYEATIFQLEAPNLSHELKLYFKDLLITLIKSDIYDVALKLAKKLLHPNICTMKLEEEALHELAQNPLDTLGFLDRWIYPITHRHDADKKRQMNKSAIELVQLLWNSLTSDETKARELVNRRDGNVILEAAKRGNFEFLSISIASYPHVLFSYDYNGYTIFHHAILNRHVEIFKLIRISSVKTIVTTLRDREGNNMLHLAGKLAPPNRLNIVPGAALQLQLELLWFEEVKKVMQPHEEKEKISSSQIKERSLEVPNKTNKLAEEYTPYDIFVKEHSELMVEGEKWMRDTANSCMIVAALITTIAFAAAITVPGGNGDNGYPNFSSETLFSAFVIADSISMVSSATSLLDFLSILTARYTIDDFRLSLPNKLFIGLTTLFVSVAAMMVAFVLSIFIIFKDSSSKLLSIFICVISSIPAILFFWQHFGLFFDVIYSTYSSFLLFKTRGDPYLLIGKKEKKRNPSYL